MPLKIIVAAKIRNINSRLPGCHFRKVGQKRLRIRANITTNMGRLLTMVETSDTGPLFSAQNDKTVPVGARISLKTSMVRVEFLRLI